MTAGPHDTYAGLRGELALLVEAELAKCAKCGACASVCPIYAQKNEEAYCARGKLLLARSLASGGLHPGPRIREMLENCLLCLACRSNCGSGVRLDQVVMAARRLLTAKQGQPLVKQLIFRSLLPSPRRMRAGMKIASLAQPVVFAALPSSSGLRRRFPLPGIAPDQPVPALAAVPFLERQPGPFAPAHGPELGQVLYFTGCAANYMLPTIGEATLYVLRKLGFGVHLPREQVCCGTPAAVNGETASVRDLAQRNLALFARQGLPVVTTCGSGGMMLRHEYPHLLATDDPLHSSAAATAATCLDISELLVQEEVFARLAGRMVRPLRHRVTYHEPCHLGRGLGVSAQPRALLRLVAENFVEMPEAARCCGSGGSYGFTHWETSRAILARKTGHARNVQAAVMATGCPACVMQLSAGADAGVGAGDDGGEAGAPPAGITVLHTIELLAWAMGYTPGREHEARRFAGLA